LHYERDRTSFDPKAFAQSILSALRESRQLCEVFESRRLGNLKEFFEKKFTMEDLKGAIAAWRARESVARSSEYRPRRGALGQMMSIGSKQSQAQS